MTIQIRSRPVINRRQMIGGLAAIGVAGCATQPSPIESGPLFTGPRRADFDPITELPPVDVRYDRIVRTTVGLRPYRPSGYRLEAEQIGETTLVHNYGHGGCGVTLSWGCSEKAAQLAIETGHDDVAVIGAGALGLTTAHILSDAGKRVTIYAAGFPPDTTSNASGALWLPSSLFSRNHVTLEKRAQMRGAARAAHARFVQLVDEPRYGVTWVRHHDLRNRPFSGGGWLETSGGEDLYPELERTDQHVPFGYDYRQSYFTLMIDPDVFLTALLDDCYAMGVELVARRFESHAEALSLGERVVVNCTGVGARNLFGDDELIPIRGQLSHLEAQPEIRHSYIAQTSGSSLYMFPRPGGIVLGGSHDRGSEDLSVNQSQIDRMIQGHASFSAWTQSGVA